MSTEQKLRDAEYRGHQAELVLKNPLVVEFFANQRETIMHNLGTCKYWKEPAERDALINMLQCMIKFEKEFNDHIRDGNNAKSKLAKLFSGDK